MDSRKWKTRELQQRPHGPQSLKYLLFGFPKQSWPTLNCWPAFTPHLGGSRRPAGQRGCNSEQNLVSLRGVQGLGGEGSAGLGSSCLCQAHACSCSRTASSYPKPSGLTCCRSFHCRSFQVLDNMVHRPHAEQHTSRAAPSTPWNHTKECLCRESHEDSCSQGKSRLKSVWVKNSHEICYKNNFWFSESRISDKGFGACTGHCYQMWNDSIPWSWSEVPTPTGCPLSSPSLLAQEAHTRHKEDTNWMNADHHKFVFLSKGQLPMLLLKNVQK